MPMDWLSQMKQHYDRKVALPFWIVVLAAILVALACVLVGLFTTKNDTAIALFGGVSGGLVVYIISFLTDIGQLKQLDRFRQMGIRNILSTRHEVVYYAQIVGQAKSEVLVMGTSCHRFITDFLDERADDKVLVDRLRRFPQLEIRFLVPSDECMDAESRTKFGLVLPKLERLQTQFGDRVKLRRFHDIARLSMVAVDGELIAGPVLPGIESRQSPAVHVKRQTEYGKKHVEYFEAMWMKTKDD